MTNIVYTHCLPAPFLPQPLQRMTAVFVNAHTHTHREKRKSAREVERTKLNAIARRLSLNPHGLFRLCDVCVSSGLRADFIRAEHVHKCVTPLSACVQLSNKISDCCEIWMFSAHWHRQEVNEITLLIITVGAINQLPVILYQCSYILQHKLRTRIKSKFPF